jgi:hypothetical protein
MPQLHLPPGKIPGTHCTGDWVGPRAGWMQRVEENSSTSVRDRIFVTQSIPVTILTELPGSPIPMNVTEKFQSSEFILHFITNARLFSYISPEVFPLHNAYWLHHQGDYSSPCWRHYTPLRCRSTFRLGDPISQKTFIFILATVRISLCINEVCKYRRQ